MAQFPRIPTSVRMLRILEAVSRSERPLTPTEINVEIGLPKQSAHRLCVRLVAENYLADFGGGKLGPGRRLRSMSSGVLFASHHHIARHQILMNAAKRIGETINYAVPEEGGMVYVDRVETDWPLRIQLAVGTRVPFHCTASGKAFLASLPESTRKLMVKSLDLEHLTQNTVRSPGALLGELQSVAENGFALDKEEFMTGMVAAAVPVLDSRSNFIAALALHGPTQRLTVGDVLEKKNILVDSAAKLRETLFT